VSTVLVFLFTDIEGSTRLWEEHPSGMGAVIARHDAILQKEITGSGGRITKHTGDGITAAFEGGAPVACALEVQKRFAVEPWEPAGELKIRVGLHAGAAEYQAPAGAAEGDYFGPAVNTTARVMSAAWGGQVLLTPAVTEVSPLPALATVLDLGEHLLKDVSNPQRIYQLLHPELRPDFPPARTLSGSSIGRMVSRRGSELQDLSPRGMAVELVSAAILPTLQGDLSPTSPALRANLGVLGDLGAGTLQALLAGFAEQLWNKQRAGRTVSASNIRERLEAKLLLECRGEVPAAVALRSDASLLLQALDGVGAAMTAATGEVKEALAQGLAELAGQFGEFRWMLTGVQDTLAEMKERQDLQLSLQREQLAKTDEILRLQRQEAPVAAVAAEPLEDAEPPAFLGAEVEPYERPVFVSREPELARLEGFLEAALAGQGCVVLVSGGPGRGKTALLNEFAGRAMVRQPKLLVGSGTCNAFSGIADPYLPFREVMGMLSGDVEEGWRSGAITGEHARRLWAAVPVVAQALLGHGPHILGTLVEGDALTSRAALVSRAALTSRAAMAGGADAPWLDSLRQAVERQQAAVGGAVPGGVAQSHVFEQFTNVLRKVGEKHPLLIILDDMQWADTASLGLLFHLGKRLGGAPVLVACAYRPEEVALGRLSAGTGQMVRHPLDKVLAEFKRSFGDLSVDLARDTQIGGREFVDALLDTEPNDLGEAFRQALHNHTGGHPLFAVELLRDLQERGDLVLDESGRWLEGPALSWERLPERVEGVIEERIGRLEQDLREALTVASVEGEEFTAQVVARVQAIQERLLLRQLSQELEKRHRLVRERSEDRVGRRRLSRYRFAHALFQQYLYNDLSAGERRLLHGEIAEVLEEIFEGRTEQVAVQLAFHYGRAELEDRALPFLIEAGNQARDRFANDEAIDYYGEALRLTPRVGLERFDLLALRAAVCRLVARCDEARADAEEMLAIAIDLADEVRRCDALLTLVQVQVQTQHLLAEEPAREALAIARALGDRVREGQALGCLGGWAWYTGDDQKSRELLEAAFTVFTEAGMPRDAARCLHHLSLALGALGELGLALEAAERAVALSRETGDRQQEATGLRRMAIAYMNQNLHGEALPYAEEALALHREVGDRAEECAALNVIGIVYAHLGEHRASEQYLRESLALAESIGSVIQVSFAVNNLLWYREHRRGDYEAALAFLETWLARAERLQDDWLTARLQLLKGLRLAWVGQHERAREALELALQLLERAGSRDDQLWAQWHLGMARALAGDYHGAREHLERAAVGAQEAQDDGNLASALGFLGLTAALEGEPGAMQRGLAQTKQGQALLPEGDRLRQGTRCEIAAALALGLGQVDEALGHSQKGVELMESEPSSWFPERRYFTHSRVLRALGREAEADEHLERAYQRVMQVARSTKDDELRRGWLEDLQTNRQILATAAERGLGAETARNHSEPVEG
jgi:predicted ATPase/class 3 adenylate cyclase